MAGETLVHEAVAREEERHLARSKDYLGGAWAVASDMCGLYVALIQSITELPDSPGKRERFIAASVLLPAAARACAVGALQAARLHFQEAEMLARRAIECAGFAAIIWDKPDLTDALMEAYDNETSFKKFRTSFGGKRLARALTRVHPELPGLHSDRSKMTHPTLQSSTLSQTQAMSGNMVEITLHFFDAQDTNWEQRLPLCFGAMLYCHQLVLRGLASQMLVEPDHKARWDALAESVFQRFEGAAGEWVRGAGAE